MSPEDSAEELRSGIGEALSTDYFVIQDQLNETQMDYLLRTRKFVDTEVLPVINGYWERAEFPRALMPKLAELGIIGDGIEGYGCPQMDPLSAGLVSMELSRGDGSLSTFVGVQGGLAMHAIDQCGSEEQKQRWLPRLASLDAYGAFALTEPDHGSDSIALETSARFEDGAWLLTGQKKWIGNGTIADVVVVWARDVADGEVKGFLVQTPNSGYEARLMEGKGALRAVWQAEITLTDARAELMSGAKTFADCAKVLVATRSSCAWMALGHAVAGYEAALTYAKRREQFGQPLVKFQIIQQRLVRMLADVTAMQLYCVQIARLDEGGALSPTLAGMAKLHNTSKARSVLAEARDLLGGNGILLDFQVMRHMADIEAIHTFEGTETIQTLIVGRDITGKSAFV